MVFLFCEKSAVKIYLSPHTPFPGDSNVVHSKAMIMLLLNHCLLSLCYSLLCNIKIQIWTARNVDYSFRN